MMRQFQELLWYYVHKVFLNPYTKVHCILTSRWNSIQKLYCMTTLLAYINGLCEVQEYRQYAYRATQCSICVRCHRTLLNFLASKHGKSFCLAAQTSPSTTLSQTVSNGCLHAVVSCWEITMTDHPSKQGQRQMLSPGFLSIAESYKPTKRTIEEVFRFSPWGIY